MTPWNVLRHQCHVVPLGTEVSVLAVVAIVIVVSVVAGVCVVVVVAVVIVVSVVSVANPDLHIRGRGGGRSSRPWGKEGAVSKKIFFGPSGLILVEK